MEKARRRHQIAWLASTGCLVALNAWADTAATLIISKATVRVPSITAYLDVRNENGEPAERFTSAGDVSRAGLTATLDGRRLPLVQLTAFDERAEGVAYFFLVDVSKSLRMAQFSDIRQAIATWIAGLGPRDRLAIASFGEDYRMLLDFTADGQAARRVLDSLSPTDSHTVLYAALQNALAVASRDDQGLPARRVLVILSDGKDEGSGVTIDDLRSQIQAARVPIYAIGHSNLRGDERQRDLDALHRLATLSSGRYREASPGSLAGDYAAINDAIRRVWVATFSCNGCRLSEQGHPLQIDLSSGPARVGDRVTVGVELAPWWRRLPAWSYFIAVGVVAVGIVLAGLTFRRPERHDMNSATILDPGNVFPPTVPGPTVLPTTSGIPITLATIKGSDSGRVHLVSLVERARIGRARECDVVLLDDEISGQHCDLLLANGHVVLRDLGSSNGTLVNGAHVANQTRVESGDVICLGRTELRISIGHQSSFGRARRPS